MEKNDLFRKTALENVSSPEQLNRYIRTATPSIIVLVCALLLVLAGALVWAFAAVLPESVSLEGILLTDGKEQINRIACVVDEDTTSRLRSGMEAQISPGSTDRDDYGYIEGTVEKITTYPVSLETLTQLVGNKELAQSMYGEGGGKLVTISFKQDASSSNGLAWSSQQGKQARISQAEKAAALVILAEYHPIDMVLKRGE